ncbi:hypothetical protein [Hydrogenophaga sp.]|uniref:hypothetical protein n=1 Tax=Hydrogenophaga sp. TaxID=1904254 RepID=UPI0026183A7A|nr:hypothetical protein [Hydrogenophaga sp.]MCW5655753.1 hypothetical protein [Hydrogenophaga sp.]
MLSFRSTEFADDAARDNQATNVLEIQSFGWAFGQIADMKAWVESLYASGKMAGGAAPTVTGYSLGGHLATAFAELWPERAAAVYTFNGAGVGEMKDGARLMDVINTFNAMRGGDTTLVTASFTYQTVRAQYETLREKYGHGGRTVEATDLEALKGLAAFPTAIGEQFGVLYEALKRIDSIAKEAVRVNQDVTNAGGTGPAKVNLNAIEALKLDYQLAVLMAQKSTEAYRSGVVLGGWQALTDREEDPALLRPGVYDIFGANKPSAVANSQHHYGKPVPVYIEDQPLARGNIVISATVESVLNVEAKLLVNDFSKNDFGDSHSLVLLVDSLAVQALLARLDPSLNTRKLAASPGTDPADADLVMERILQTAGNLRGNSEFLQQGEAEGDTLENVLNALSRMLGVAGTPLNGDPHGGTWARVENSGSYTGREELHKTLKAIDEKVTASGLEGRLIVKHVDSHIAADARLDFGALLALKTLSPFYLDAKDHAGQTALNAIWREAHGSDFLAWQSDRGAVLYGTAYQGLGFTDEWLADRAAMLQALAFRNQHNVGETSPTAPNPSFGLQAGQYLDMTTGTTVMVGTSTASTRQVVFGTQGAEMLQGGMADDRFYGGAGDDNTLHLDGGGHDVVTMNSKDAVRVMGQSFADVAVRNVVLGDGKLDESSLLLTFDVDRLAQCSWAMAVRTPCAWARVSRPPRPRSAARATTWCSSGPATRQTR